MQAVVLVFLVGVSLCEVHGSDEQHTPDVLSMVTKLETRVQTLENALAQKQQSGQQVAFFADLGTGPASIGPANLPSAIVYINVVTNIGNGYNSATGIFTAPVRGLYVFHVSAYASVMTPPFGPVLKKNTEALANPLVLYTAGKQDATSRVAVVTLERGDTVSMVLPERVTYLDLVGNLNSFSGFLLSPM